MRSTAWPLTFPGHLGIICSAHGSFTGTLAYFSELTQAGNAFAVIHEARWNKFVYTHGVATSTYKSTRGSKQHRESSGLKLRITMLTLLSPKPAVRLHNDNTS